MQAVVIHAPHDLRLEDRPLPAPGPGEVLVRVRAGGICGSDLHYYHNAGFGTVRIQEPMVLGHEAAGEIAALGEGVTGLAVGQRVSINPSRPMGDDEYIREGMRQHAMDMRFNGSAMRIPHEQGFFREAVAVPAVQAVPVPDDTPFEVAACAEPLAVALHAVRQAGSLTGKRVLVTGTGAIGCLVILAARHAGAAEIIATDIADAALVTAAKVGADVTLNTAADAGALDRFKADKGRVHVAFECSGAGAVLASLLDVVRPRGTIVAVGLGRDVTLPVAPIVTKELVIRGTFRFDAEFAWAADLLGSGRIDVTPLLSAQIPAARAVEAFELATDRARAVKVHLTF